MSDKRDTKRFLAHRGHWTDSVIIDRNGGLYAVLQVFGIPSELAGVDAIVAAHAQDNALLLGVADPRLEWWEHYSLLDGQGMPDLPEMPNWYGARFDAAYRVVQQASDLCRQSLFLTLVWHPGDGLRQAMGAVWNSTSSDFPEAGDRDLELFEGVVGRVMAGLSRRYRARRLALRDGTYSEIAEAWLMVLQNREGVVPIGDAPIGPCIVPDRLIFGYRGGEVPAGVLEMAREGGSAYGAILSCLQTPARTRPTMLDTLRSLLIPITITNSARLGRRGTAVKALTDQQNRMDAARDPSIRQRAELVNEAERIEDGEVVQVDHHFSVAVFGPSVSVLGERVACVQSALSDVGISGVRETDALKAAYYAQLPGNARWRVRRAPMKSSNMLSLAAKHAATTGDRTSRWGEPLIYLRTTAGTALPFHWHVRPTPQMPKGDLGNTLVVGRSGAGKTATMGALALCTLRVPRARIVICDRDLGLYPMVRATGGAYLRQWSGRESGWAPLRGLSDTPSDRDFLWGFVRDLILSDGRGSVTEEEGAWLAQAIEREMRKPSSMRSLKNIGAVLGVRDREGAAARLRPWCRGEVRGWAFDGETDQAHEILGARMAGFDTTRLLDDSLICGPALAYQFHLVDALANGDPLLLVLDEVWAANQVEAFRDRNNAWLKTGRKQEIVLALATQSSRDILNSPIRHTLLQQSPRRVYFGEATADREDLVEGMGLTEAEYRVVTEVLPNTPFSFLVQEPGGGYIGRFDLSAIPGVVATISGRTSTADLVDRLIAEHGERPEQWVPHFESFAPGIVDNPTLARTA